MKAITISVVNKGFLVQGYPLPDRATCYEPPLHENLFVYTSMEDLQKDLPLLLAPAIELSQPDNQP